MNITFIVPPHSAEATYPLEIARLVRIANESGHTYKCYDLNRTKDHKKILQSIISTDIVFLSTTNVGIPAYPHGLKKFFNIAKQLSQKGCTVITGGSYCNINLSIFIESEFIHYTLYGDVEYIFNDVLSSLVEERLFSSGVIKSGSRTFKPYFKSDLSDFPLPNYNAFDTNNYAKTIASGGKISFPIITSLGCIRGCKHCLTKRNSTFRIIPNIKELLDDITSIEPNAHLLIEDDNFAPNIDNFCQILSDNHFSFTWECINGVDPDEISVKQISTMATLGCRHIAFGIESWSANILSSLNRNLDKSKLRSLLKACKNQNVMTSGYFILNLPNISFFKEIILFLKTLFLPFDLYHVTPLYPTRGIRIKVLQKFIYIIYYLNPIKYPFLLKVLIRNPINTLKKAFNKINRTT